MERPIKFIINGVYHKAIDRHKTGIWIISLESLLTAVGFSIVIPFLSLYLYQERGLSMTTVGSIMMIAGFCSALAHIFGGELSDRIGRRPVVLIALFVRAIMYAGMAALIAISAPLWTIIIFYVFGQSIGMIERPAASAIMTDLSSKKQLMEAFSLLRVGINLGWAAGPAIGGYLAIFLPYSWLFSVSAIFTAIALIIVFTCLKESRQRMKEKMDPRNLKSILKDKPFLAFSIISLFVFLLMGQMMSTLSIYTIDFLKLSTAQYGLLLTTNGLIVVFLQYPVSYILRKVYKSGMILFGSLLYTIGYLIFGFAGGFMLSILAMVVITIGEIIHAPASLSLVGELAPARYSGRYMGVFGLTQIMGIAMGPLIGGLLIDIFPTSPLLLWGFISLLGVVSIIGYYIWSIKYKPGDMQAG